MDDYETMMRDYRERMKDYLDLMDKYPQLTLNWGNLYNLNDFLEYFPEQKARIKALTDRGRISYPAQWVAYEPDWTPGEYIVRQTGYSIAYLKKQFGYRPTWCHLLDVPSITPQYAQILNKSGIKMSLLHFNYHNPDYARNFAPPGLAINAEDALRGGVYEYVGLDGSGIIGYLGKEHYSMLLVAFGWGQDEFGSWRQSMDRFARHFTPEESAAGLKLVHGDEDHGLTPSRIPALIDSINSWNRGSAHAGTVTLRFGTVDEFVRGFQGKSSSLELTGYTGQTRPWVWSGRFWERGRYYLNRAVSDILAAEKAASFNALLGLKKYPENEIDRVWRDLFWPADHNWLAGTDTDGFKADAVFSASLQAQQILDRELYTLAAAVKAEPGKKAVVVFNPLNRKRSQPVTVKISSRVGWIGVRDCETGKTREAAITGRTRSGRTVEFIATDVPPLGYKTFYLVESSQASDVLQSPELSARGDTIENEFYKVTFDPVIGIRSIFDKRNSREMVCPGFMGLEGAFLTDTASVTPVFAARSLRYQGKRLTVRLYRGLDLVDILIHADDKDFMLDMAGIFLPHEYGSLIQRAPELLASSPNVIPVEFNLNRPQLTCGTPFGAVPYVQAQTMSQFPMKLDFSRRSPKAGFVSWFQDFGGLPNAVNISQWLDCHEPETDYGVSLAYTESQTEVLVASPGILRIPLYYQHPLENTVLRSPHRWHFVLRGHKGDWKAANTPLFGWEVSQPLIARERLSLGGSTLPVQGSFITLDNPSVVVPAIKKSYYDNSFVVHLAELVDSDCAVELRPSIIKPSTLSRINLSEDQNLGPLEAGSNGNRVIKMKGFGIEAVSLSVK